MTLENQHAEFVWQAAVTANKLAKAAHNPQIRRLHYRQKTLLLIMLLESGRIIPCEVNSTRRGIMVSVAFDNCRMHLPLYRLDDQTRVQIQPLLKCHLGQGRCAQS